MPRRRPSDEEAYWDRQDALESSTGWMTQDRTPDAHTSVKGGESYDLGVPTTEFVIADRDGSGHQHVVLDDGGNEIYNERVDGR